LNKAKVLYSTSVPVQQQQQVLNENFTTKAVDQINASIEEGGASAMMSHSQA